MGGSHTTENRYHYGMSSAEQQRFNQMMTEISSLSTESKILSHRSFSDSDFIDGRRRVAVKFLEDEVNRLALDKKKYSDLLEELEKQLFELISQMTDKIDAQREAFFKSKLDEAVQSTLNKCSQEKYKMDQEYARELAEDEK